MPSMAYFISEVESWAASIGARYPVIGRLVEYENPAPLAWFSAGAPDTAPVLPGSTAVCPMTGQAGDCPFGFKARKSRGAA